MIQENNVTLMMARDRNILKERYLTKRKKFWKGKKETLSRFVQETSLIER